MKIKDLFRRSSVRSNAKDLTGYEVDPDGLHEGMTKYSKAYNLEELHDERMKVMTERFGTNFKENSKDSGKRFLASELGAMTFKASLFKQELKTPHFEIQKSLESYEEIPHIAAGINQIVLFITGNNIRIVSEDEYTTQWYEKWMKQRPHMFESIQNIVLLCEVCGNSYIEPIWDELDDGQVYMNDFKVVPDPSRVYYNLNEPLETNYIGNQHLQSNLDDIEDAEFWIYQVPFVYQNYDSDLNVQTYRITYIKNSLAWQETVYGIPRGKNDFLHFKVGWSRYGYYGRSYLASTIDDVEILTQLLKNYAIASRYMAMGKKVFSILPEEGEILSTTELDQITQRLNEPEDEEHITINRKLAVTELSPTQFNEMSGPLNYVRKDISSGVTPNFMTAWADTVTFASANKAAIPFELSLENKRSKYIELLNRNILENVRTQNPKLKDATFDFGEVSLDDVNETIRVYTDLWERDLITMNQFLKKANLPTVENGDVYKSQRNFMLQRDYKMTQSDVEQYDEPFLKRTIQKDRQDFEGEGKKGKEEEIEDKDQDQDQELKDVIKKVLKKEFKTYKEKKDRDVVSALEFIKDDKDFIKQLIKRYPELKKSNVIKSQFIKNSDILRLCQDKDEQYFIVRNLTLKDNTYADKKVATKAFDNELENIKIEYENFFVGDTDIEQLADELFKEVKEMQWEITKDLLEELKKSSIKEGYFKGNKIFKEKNIINPNILGNIDGMFDIFNTKLKAKIDGMINKLAYEGVEIVDDMPDGDEVEEVSTARSLLGSLIFDQFQTFNNNQSQNIKRVLTNGILGGSSVKDVEQELKDEVIDWKKYKPSDADYRIQRIANTEVHKAGLQLKLINWKNMGIEHVKYLATVDEATRPKHRAHHNRIFNIDDALNLPEWKEINCRCTFIPWSL